MFKFVKKAKYVAYLTQVFENIEETLKGQAQFMDMKNSYLITSMDFQRPLRDYNTLEKAWGSAENEIRVKAASVMNMKLMKAIPIKPVIINVIPKPLSGAGTFEYLIFSRMAAIATIARNQPTPDPRPKTVASAMVEYCLSCIKRAPPRIEQFTAINGRKIPNAPYKAGETFSTTISTNCTIDAITAINIIKLKKERSVFIKSEDIHVNAPDFKT